MPGRFYWVRGEPGLKHVNTALYPGFHCVSSDVKPLEAVGSEYGPPTLSEAVEFAGLNEGRAPQKRRPLSQAVPEVLRYARVSIQRA